MKFNTIMKLISALAAAAGAVYIIATYGDKIVAWAKGIMDCCSKPVACAPEAAAEESDFAEETVKEEAPAQAEEAPEAAAPQESEEEPALSEDAIPVADEEDFEG